MEFACEKNLQSIPSTTPAVGEKKMGGEWEWNLLPMGTLWD